MSNLNNVTFFDVAKNSDKYEFKVQTILMRPKLEIYNKENGKRIAEIAEMDAVVHNGIMNQEYADTFFDDITKIAKMSFIKSVLKEDKENGTEG